MSRRPPAPRRASQWLPRVQMACGIIFGVGLVVGVCVVMMSKPDLLARMVFRAQRGVAPGARVAVVQEALSELVAHLNDETSMPECVKAKLVELRRVLKQNACSEPAVATVPPETASQEAAEQKVLNSAGKDDETVALSDEEQEFVRRLLRINNKPLTKHQSEALQAVRASNRALYDTLVTEVAAESGEYRLPDTLPEGLSGTAGLGGQGLPAWDRKLHMNPNTNEAIFVALVTYRDPQCPQSLVEAFSRASQPSRVFIGVVQQNRESDVDCFAEYCKIAGSACRPTQVRVIRMTDAQSRGVMLARWLASTLWAGERWYLQVDAHSGFNYAWDDMVVESILRTGDERAVLSHHPPDMATWPGAAGGENVINICKYHWDETGLPRFSSTMVNKKANAITKPFPNAFIGAGMVFGRAQWIVDCPFDHNLQYLFSGEELLLSVCLFTKGWNVYNPDVLPVWHWYKRNIAGRENPSIGHLRDKAVLRLKYLLGLVEAKQVPRDFLREVQPYLMGNIRTREEFWQYAGVDWKSKTVQTPFCAVHVNSRNAASIYKFHFNKPKGLPALESYQFETVPMVPIKYKSTAAPLQLYLEQAAKETPSLPRPKLKKQ